MDRTLAGFLLQLVMFDEKRNTFVEANDEDKKHLMTKFGLSPHQYNAVLSGDLVKILNVLNEEYGPLPGDVMIP